MVQILDTFDLVVLSFILQTFGALISHLECWKFRAIFQLPFKTGKYSRKYLSVVMRISLM